MRIACFLALFLTAPSALQAASASLQKHPVQAVQGDRLVVNYAGLPVTVRLADIAMDENMKSHANLKIHALIDKQPVRVVFSEEAGLDENGLPQVYIITKGYRNVNVQLVEHGLAKYNNNSKPPKRYHGMMVTAERTAQRQKRGVWSGGGGGDAATASVGETSSAAAKPAAAEAASGGECYSELNSSQYHSPNCKWTARMNPQRRIRYKSFEAAEKSNKRPCWICLPKRAEERTFGGHNTKSSETAVQFAKGKGPIMGYQGEFHSPVCPKLRGKTGLSGYPNKDLARASGGLKPCNFCLRLRYKPPGPGECMGRSPGYWRPCQRKAVGNSGLCNICQGKE